MEVDRVVMDAERTAWVEIEQGIYTRYIPEDERQVDRHFVERVAEAVDSPNLRLLVLETGRNPSKSTRRRERKGLRGALVALF